MPTARSSTEWRRLRPRAAFPAPRWHSLGYWPSRLSRRPLSAPPSRYWSIVENRRIGGGRVVQRPLLYLGEINDSQELAWRKSIAILEEGALQPRTLSLFPEDRCEGLLPD